MLRVHVVDAVDAVAAEDDATVAYCFTPDVAEDALTDAVVDLGRGRGGGAGRARMRARCRTSHQQPESHDSHKSSAPCHGLIVPRIDRARGESDGRDAARVDRMWLSTYWHVPVGVLRTTGRHLTFNV